MATTAKTIPWVSSSNGAMSLWIWKTEHFTAKISSNRGSFTWEITYPDNGMDKVLYDEAVDDFPEAEMRVRETVGKSFPKSMGYSKYAGNLANTFRVNSGVMFDFTPLIGSLVNLHYRTRNETGTANVEYSVRGVLEVQHYNIIIRERDGSGLQIPPGSVVRLFDAKDLPIPLDERVESKNSRVMPGKFMPRCTGQPGTVPGTVEHPEGSPWCPVHE